MKETALCLKAGRVTLPYPAQPRPAPANFRGRPVFDPERCVGCGGCASNCPARAILVFDMCQEVRVLEYVGARCTYCARCADVCPEKAIHMDLEFQTATDRAGDIHERLQLFMSTCQRCGRCFQDATGLEQLKMKGYRFDNVAGQRWVFRSAAYLRQETAVDDIAIEMD